MNYKKIISSLLDEEIKLSILQKDKDKFKLLHQKIMNDEILQKQDKDLIINDILSQKLSFDNDGNPIGDTLAIEEIIDYFSSQ